MGGIIRDEVKVAVKVLKEGARLPTYGTDQAAGADLYAYVEGDAIKLDVGERKLIPCEIAIELPEGYEAQVRPRSGLALKQGITVLNAPGTIDSDYRGPIGVVLYNAGQKPFYINHHDRIAQMVVAPVSLALFSITEDELSETERGEGGYGSTGVAG
jgi:dUTP pyrophosphatase